MNTLQVAAESPWWMHAGAWLILWLHISGGSLGILAGAAAITFRKGSRPHIWAGRLFFGSMLVMTAIGAAVAPFLIARDGGPKWFDSGMAVFTFYLVLTGWMTMRRKAGTIGRFELFAFLFAAAWAATQVTIGTYAAQRPTGTLGGTGATGFYMAAGVIALAAALDLNMILRGGLTGVPRLARHLWRLCAAWFVATGSFFLGQQRNMPEVMQGSPWLYIPALAPLVLMVFWLLKLRLAKVWKRIGRKPRGPGAAAVASAT